MAGKGCLAPTPCTWSPQTRQPPTCHPGDIFETLQQLSTALKLLDKSNRALLNLLSLKSFGADRFSASLQKSPLVFHSSHHLQEDVSALLSQEGIWHELSEQRMFSHTDCMKKVKQTETALPAQATQNRGCVGTLLPQAGGKQSSPSAMGKEEDMCSLLPLLFYFNI